MIRTANLKRIWHRKYGEDAKRAEFERIMEKLKTAGLIENDGEAWMATDAGIAIVEAQKAMTTPH